MKKIKAFLPNVKAYFLCVYANKFTFAGYVIFIASYIACFCLQTNPHRYLLGIGIATGAFLLWGTRLGFDTYDAYERVMDACKNEKEARRFNHINWLYCDIVGYKLAIRVLKKK